jgi:hypothetical protein
LNIKVGEKGEKAPSPYPGLSKQRGRSVLSLKDRKLTGFHWGEGKEFAQIFKTL